MQTYQGHVTLKGIPVGQNILWKRWKYKLMFKFLQQENCKSTESNFSHLQIYSLGWRGWKRTETFFNVFKFGYDIFQNSQKVNSYETAFAFSFRFLRKSLLSNEYQVSFFNQSSTKSGILAAAWQWQFGRVGVSGLSDIQGSMWEVLLKFISGRASGRGWHTEKTFFLWAR